MPHRLRVVAPLLAILLMLGGCNVVAVGYQDPAAKAEAIAAFRAGGAVFHCGQGLSCAVRWSAARSAASRLVVAGRWEDVADVVLGAGYEQDLTWFYLGLAAEGLGQGQAARTYYDNSVRRSLYGAGYACTAAGMMSCDGVRLPDDAKAQLAGLDPRGRTRRPTDPSARLGTGGGGGAMAYAQRLGSIRAQEEAAPARPTPGGSAQASGCPTNFRC